MHPSFGGIRKRFWKGHVAVFLREAGFGKCPAGPTFKRFFSMSFGAGGDSASHVGVGHVTVCSAGGYARVNEEVHYRPPPKCHLDFPLL